MHKKVCGDISEIFNGIIPGAKELEDPFEDEVRLVQQIEEPPSQVSIDGFEI